MAKARGFLAKLLDDVLGGRVPYIAGVSKIDGDSIGIWRMYCLLYVSVCKKEY